MKTRILLLLLIISNTLFGQLPLSRSPRSSTYQYIYRVSAREAFTLYQTGLAKVGVPFLHTLVDSFPVGAATPSLPQGNYLLLQALENRLKYELVTIGDLQLKLVNNRKDLVVMLHDGKGNIVKDATVTLKGRHLKYDAATQTYRLNDRRRKGNLRVTYADAAFYFPIETSEARRDIPRVILRKAINSFPLKYITKTVRRWRGNSNYYVDYFDRPVDYERKFKGFMTFNKPIYKPGDTVRLKAFVMNRQGKGIREKLLVRLTDRNLDIDTIISVVDPYRPGGYIHEFVLSDSLELDLDEGYLVTLEEERSRKYDLDAYEGNLREEQYAAKRKVVMRGKFNYEEYELESIIFSARTESKEHSRGKGMAVFLKATDENDLPVMDGRLQINVLPSSMQGVAFHKPKVFLPDTLWTWTQPLETVGETKINIPDSIFPHASFKYVIECILLNSNNERHVQELSASFTNADNEIMFHLAKDSLRINVSEKGSPVKAPAIIYAFDNRDDTLQVIHTDLPATIKLNPYVHSYQAVALNVVKKFELLHTRGMVSALTSRTKDSLFIRLNNPHRLPVWYTLFAGNKVIARGYADSLSLSTKTRTPRNYALSIQYIFGNELYREEYTVPYQDRLLKLSVSAPQVIYPGQTSSIEIGVTDLNNQKIAGADVTAYAFTRKFTNAAAPAVPYLGKVYRYRRRGHSFVTAEPEDWTQLVRLNWERWSRGLGLDTIEYYKFLYPEKFYRNEEAVTDGSTQIAPFVVIKGEVQPIHFLYIDEKPHFFSKSQHLQRYSFKVSPGKHSLRIRTHNRVITLNDLALPKGVKSIISINGDTSNKSIAVTKAPDTLTINEKALLARYTILVDNHYGERLSFVRQGENHFLLPKSAGSLYGSTPVLGPLLPATAELVVKDRFKQLFDVEGGYLYHIREGLIKQKQINGGVYISKWLSGQTPAYNFTDVALTAAEIDSLWKSYLDHRSANSDLFINAPIAEKGAGELKIELQKERAAQQLFVKNIFLFRFEDTDFLRVYKGNLRDLGFLHPGAYRVLILLKDDFYIVEDNVYIRKDGINYYSVSAKSIKPPDSVSRRLADVIRSRELAHRGNMDGLDQIKESFNSGFLDASSFTNIIFGRLLDDKGTPVPGASVSIKGTRYSTSTDASGYYRIQAPQKGTLVFQSVGFSATEQTIKEGFMDAVLVPSSNRLEEVVVVGYSVTRKASYTSSIAISNELSGKASGVVIRGAATMNGSLTPLLLVDGVIFEGSITDLDPALIASITTLKADVALALYGAKASGGVLMITTRKSSAEMQAGDGANPGSANSLRRRFRDDAYWQPTLRTDAEGKVRFTTTFPDDITNWRTYAIAIADGKRTGFAEGLIRSFKPISANLSLPQFAVEGDSLNIIGKTLNYGSDSIRLIRRIKINDSLVREGALHFQNSAIDTVAWTVAAVDSLHFRLEVQKEEGYYDGEERTVPVYKQGVLETKGMFAALDGDTTITVQLDPALGPVTVHAEASLLPVLLDETERLHRYEYLCNEQLASKLKGLLSQKKIYTLLKREFKHEKTILDLISRLNSAKTGNLWGWWSNNEPAPWISLHVIEALLEAEKDAYKVNLNKTGIIDNLVFNLEHYRGTDKVLSLRLLQQLNAKVDYKAYIDSIEKGAARLQLYDRLRLIEVKQHAGIAARADSLLALARQTLFNAFPSKEDREVHHFCFCRI